jgi:hypothetical protein
MPIVLTEVSAEEGSSFFFDISFTDENGDAIAPLQAAWTLSDMQGNVINNREQVAISNPTGTDTVVISGDDLQLLYNADDRRIFTVEASYDSTELGYNIPIREWIQFTVNNSPFPKKEE